MTRKCCNIKLMGYCLMNCIGNRIECLICGEIFEGKVISLYYVLYCHWFNNHKDVCDFDEYIGKYTRLLEVYPLILR